MDANQIRDKIKELRSTWVDLIRKRNNLFNEMLNENHPEDYDYSTDPKEIEFFKLESEQNNVHNTIKTLESEYINIRTKEVEKMIPVNNKMNDIECTIFKLEEEISKLKDDYFIKSNSGHMVFNEGYFVERTIKEKQILLDNAKQELEVYKSELRELFDNQ